MVTHPSYWSHTSYWSHSILLVTNPSYWSHTHPTGHTHPAGHIPYWSHTHPTCHTHPTGHTVSYWSQTHPTGHTSILLVTHILLVTYPTGHTHILLVTHYPTGHTPIVVVTHPSYCSHIHKVWIRNLCFTYLCFPHKQNVLLKLVFRVSRLFCFMINVNTRVLGFHYLLTSRKYKRYKKWCPNLPQWCPNLPHVPNYPVPPYTSSFLYVPRLLGTHRLVCMFHVY